MSLPFELVEIVVGMLVPDDVEPGYLWAKRRCSANGQLTPLCALTEVAHIWRVVAMRTIWRTVKVCRTGKDLSSMIHLRRLYDHMSLGAAKDYIEEIQVTLPSECRGDRGYSKREWRFFKEECTKGLSRQDEGSINDTQFERDVLCNLARRLSVHLAQCRRLKSLSWTGWLVPDLVILDNLSRCPKLARISLNLGLAGLDHHDFCWPVNDIKARAVVLPPKHEPFPALDTIDFAFEPSHLLGCSGLSWRHHYALPSFVAILIQYHAIPRHFKIAPLFLLCQPCMLPI